MIALVVQACLAAQPATCSPTVIAWAESPAALSCAAEAPAALQDWMARNPEMVVQAHWCMPGRGQAAPVRATLADGRILPLDPCQVDNRAKAVIWSARNPGVSSVAACAARGTVSN